MSNILTLYLPVFNKSTIAMVIVQVREIFSKTHRV